MMQLITDRRGNPPVASYSDRNGNNKSCVPRHGTPVPNPGLIVSGEDLPQFAKGELIKIRLYANWLNNQDTTQHDI